MGAPEVEKGLLSAGLDVKERLRLFLGKRSDEPGFGVCIAKHHELEALRSVSGTFNTPFTIGATFPGLKPTRYMSGLQHSK